MSDYVKRLSGHRRLTILRFLNDAPEYTSNASILVEVCNDFGITSTRDQIGGELGWLADQGLVTFEDHDGFIVATVTSRGIDVSQGRSRVAGVKRPRPGQ